MKWKIKKIKSTVEVNLDWSGCKLVRRYKVKKKIENALIQCITWLVVCDDCQISKSENIPFSFLKIWKYFSKEDRSDLFQVKILDPQ